MASNLSPVTGWLALTPKAPNTAERTSTVRAKIPKSVAVSASELEFFENPVVLEDDPIVKWQLQSLPKDQTKDYGYTVDKEVEEIPPLTVAAGDEPGAVAKFVRFLIHGGWILVVILIVGLIVGIPIMAAKRKK